MKTFMLALGLALVGLRGCPGCDNPVGAQPLTSWGDIKAQLEEEQPVAVDSLGKLVVTNRPVAGRAEPRIEITAVSPPHLLSAGNGVVIDAYEIKAFGKFLVLSSLPIRVPVGLRNVQMYLSDFGVSVGPTIVGPGVHYLPFLMQLDHGTTLRIEFRAEVINFDGTLPEEGTHLSVDLAEGRGARRGYTTVSTPAVKGVGGDVHYPPACIGTGFSPIDGTPCIPETAE